MIWNFIDKHAIYIKTIQIPYEEDYTILLYFPDLDLVCASYEVETCSFTLDDAYSRYPQTGLQELYTEQLEERWTLEEFYDLAKNNYDWHMPGRTIQPDDEDAELVQRIYEVFLKWYQDRETPIVNDIIHKDGQKETKFVDRPK